MRYQQFDTWMAMQGPCRQSTVAATHRSVCALGNMTRAYKSGQPTMELKSFTSFTLLPKTSTSSWDWWSRIPANLLYTDLIPVAKDGPPGIVVTDGGCSIVADAQGAARAVEAMKTHLADVEVCKMGAAVLYVTCLSEKIWEKKTAHVERGHFLGVLSFSNSEVLV